MGAGSHPGMSPSLWKWELGLDGHTWMDGHTDTTFIEISKSVHESLWRFRWFLNHTGMSDRVPGKIGVSLPQGPHSGRAGAAAGSGFQGRFLAKMLMSNKKVLLNLAGRKEGREQRG